MKVRRDRIENAIDVIPDQGTVTLNEYMRLRDRPTAGVHVVRFTASTNSGGRNNE